MECPTKLKFGGLTYDIQFVEYIEKNLLGRCDHDKTLIRVATTQSPESIKSTALHEAIHAAAHAIHWPAREDTVLKMETMFMTLIRDNPKFIRWLLRKAE